ncbi:MAG: glycosyltransferase family 4 protein [Solirubrobacteraceae bacterium]
MRVDLLDPPAYSLSYDAALAGALGALGAQVRLITSKFAYGEPPDARGYTVLPSFYRHARGPAGSRLRALAKRAQDVPDLLAYRRGPAKQADVSHFQWLTLPRVDLRLLPDIPTVLTIHDPLERGGRRKPINRDAFRRVDAVIVLTRYAREQVIAAHGLDPSRVHVIPHGAHGPDGTDPPQGHGTARLPHELHDNGTPAVLCFGLLRPYKGVQTLLSAWREVEAAQLWIVGRPMMDLTALRAAMPRGVQLVDRFVSRAEEHALFSRADIVVLPYERSDRFGFSGVLATALGYGRAIVLSAVDGLSEVAQPDQQPYGSSEPAAQLVPPGDPEALGLSLRELLADPAARQRLEHGALTAAATTYSWERIASRTLELYARITA